MDIKEYISSGILESYALGLVSDQERREVECMSAIYPEIRQELEKLAQAMEEMARVHQVQPPAGLKSKIFAQLAQEKVSAAVAVHPKNDTATKIVPIGQPSSAIKWLAAACFAGLLVAAVLYVNERSQTNTLNNQLQALRDREQEKQQTIDRLTAAGKTTQQELAMFRNPDFKTVFLRPVPNKPQGSLAIVCCNVKSGETVMAVENLPRVPGGKQYQLWAIVNGTPVDMGVLPKDSVATRSFFKMKDIEGAQAFAITMEKEGGSPTPTLEEMYAMGAI